LKKPLKELASVAIFLFTIFLAPLTAHSTPVTFEFEGVIGLACHKCGDGSAEFGTGVPPGTPFSGRYTFDSDTVATPTSDPSRVNYFGVSAEFSIGGEFVSNNNAATSRITIHDGPPQGDSYTLYFSTFGSGSIAGVSIDSFSWVVSATSGLFADSNLPTSSGFFGPRLGSRVCIGDCFSGGGILEGKITSLRLVSSSKYGGVEFPAGAISFADKVIRYDPTYRGGNAPDETQQDARQILGVPEQGEMSLGRGGRIRVQFLDNSLTGSDDSQPDLHVFEVGAPETTIVDISKDGMRWFRIGTVSGFASGIDIDQFGFDSSDHFSYVRITDDGDWVGDHHFTAGADLVAVGARSSGPPVDSPPPINYLIQAHVGGRSELIIQRSMLQWHHLKGPAPGLERQFWNPGKDANSPTIIDSNHGPNITWVPEGWPINLGNGTHPESHSSMFNGLTPVFPSDGRCWRVEKLWGDGKVKIVQQPNSSNGFSLVVRFDDLIVGRRGALHNLSGSGFYSIRLSRTFKIC